MRLRLARTAGFCMGVRRAVEIAEEAAADGPVYTHGPLIHNRQAVQALEERGVRVAEAIDALAPGRLVIRAHGLPRAEHEALTARGFDCIDATCPHVLASQKRIRAASAEGREIVLVGDPKHAEVIGLAGHATTPVHIISTPAQARDLQPGGPVSVLAQTTFHAETYAEIVDVLRERFDEITVHDSICRATAERQEEARSLAAECDAVVVVGGRHSANTRRLAEVAGADGTPVYHVETADELDLERLAEHPVIGVTAGASTPGWLTQTVLDRLQTLNRRGAGGMLRGLLIGAVRSYLYSAVAAVGLALAAMHLLGLQTLPLGTLALVFAYVFVVYTINRRATQPRGNPAAGGRPPRGRENRLLLAASGLGLGSLALAWHYGPGVLLLLALAYAAGIIYTVPLLPRRFSRRRLKDIPASKDLFVAAAWAVVLTGLPVLVAGLSPLGEAALGTGAIVFLLVFGKTVALDLRDTEGDRLIGTETIPVLAGRRAALRLLYALQVLVLGALVALTAATIFPPVGWALALLPLYGLGYLRLFDKGLLAEETRCQAIVDGQFLLAGVLTAAMHLAGLGGGAG